MINFKGAIFDLDGTILDSMWVWKEVDKIFLGRRGIQMPDDYMEKITPLGFVETANYTVKRFNLPDTPEELINEWDTLALNEYKNNVGLKPGALQYLKYLKNNNIKLCVATASSPTLYEPALKNHGIYDLFDSFTHADEVSHGKESPDIYLRAAEKINVLPKDCVVFEDIYVGIKSANNGGFYTIGVHEAFSEKDKEKIILTADMYIHSFEELF